jgi:selenocysteine lyase/cysteine desulfurase
MNTSRRSFFKKAGEFTAMAAITPVLFPEKLLDIDWANLNSGSSGSVTTDEDFWYQIKHAYTVSPNIINLNNGGVSPQPAVVQNAVDRYNKLSNEAPSYYMWRILDQGREGLRSKLAELAGSLPEEIAINRNATEALDTVIFGLDLKAGDEVVLTKQDYPNMIQAWKQREMRDKIKLVWINLDLPIEDDNIIVEKFKVAITSKTKVLHITHVINWTGQILPVQKLSRMAKPKGIEILVDGAHSFAHFDFKIPELECDYFGTSLHKWLSAPFGSGMLWVKKEKIAGIWPLFPNPDPKSADIKKFESLGTRSFPTEQAIGQAVDFQNMIGNKRKEDRLRYLKNYWCEKVSKVERVKLNTSLKPEFSCAIAHFSIAGIEPADIDHKLFHDYKIHTVPIIWENIKGIRVTPHVYTSIKEMDRLVEAITKIAKS